MPAPRAWPPLIGAGCGWPSNPVAPTAAPAAAPRALAAGAGLLYPTSPKASDKPGLEAGWPREFFLPMRFIPLTVTCPACGSGDVVYSCTPDCCFNHVCNACLKSFELSTKDTGESLEPAPLAADEGDSCAPTVSCARCGSLRVLMIEGGASGPGLACSSCHTLLELEIVND